MAIDVLRSKIVLAGLSYIKPVFKASYIEVGVTAEVTFPDVLTVDIVTPTDIIRLEAQKVLLDNTNGFSDYLNFNFQKRIQDSSVILDSLVIGDIQPHRASADVISTPLDYLNNTFSKVLADSVTLTDVADAFKLYIRDYADSVLPVDQTAITDVPGTKTDSASTLDLSTLSTGKNVSDGLNLHDDMDGILDFAFVKVTSELLASSDSNAIVFTGQKADNIATSSSGVLSMQDYCDITYFLEDYVGISRTFT